MTNMTDKQRQALRAWKVPEAKIQSMDFETASKAIGDLINAKNQKTNTYPSKERETQTAKVGVVSPNIQPSSSQKPLPISIEEKVSNRLAKAKKIVHKEFENPEEYTEYLILVTECMHEIFAEESIKKIQAAKERNIQAVR